MKLVELMLARAAKGSVGPSTARGMGPPGTIAAAKNFLLEFELKKIKTSSEKAFRVSLNETTVLLQQSLPKGARHWGSSRKFINIYLRNCLYNRYICDEYSFSKVEEWLEVPLDSHVGKGLRLETHGASLPGWKTVIGLTEEVSSQYQATALAVAREKKIARVHLDLLYWRGVHIVKTLK
jgi:hypothetical protein